MAYCNGNKLVRNKLFRINFGKKSEFQLIVLKNKPNVICLASVQDPKGFRAPGIQDGKFGALGLHHSTPAFHLARISISVRDSY